ncbi:AMIN domain-containing protein [Archangium primigenium]|uniref:AMIN domain-containing protein n=1 Tax=[Archangium] primigenium TaxID=2792470 RepID=UPI0019572AD8|nr:AMIN domain-containing protein [Archangium primigenium]MBM7115122.1 AMIN domain-containing protein [Archangium primigenium]
MRSLIQKSFPKLLVLALLVGVWSPARAQEAGALNAITSVNVRGGTVEIVGTKKPNFTTFSLTDPPRLVIDIAEATFSGVKEDIAVGNGTITAIRTAGYGSDDSSIARVLIGYAREVETDIQARGNTLVVSVAGAGGTAVAALTPPPTPTPAPAAPTPPPAAQTPSPGGASAPTATAPATNPGGTADQAAQAAQEERKRQDAAAAQATLAAQEERKRQEAAATQAAQEERKRQEAAAAQATQAREAEARRQAEARAEADRKARVESERVAAQQAEQQRAQAETEKQRRDAEARAAAELKQRQAAEDKARRDAEARAAAEERQQRQQEARAAAEQKQRDAAEERRQRQEEARAAAEERRRERDEARQERLAQAEPPARVAPEQGTRAAVSSRRKTLALVGFRQVSGGSRIFLRTDEPVRYSVSKAERTVVLELENTRVDVNNTRPLDTSFFDTAVNRVEADPGPAQTVRVTIRLKQQVPFQTHQEGNELSIEFLRPDRR